MAPVDILAARLDAAVSEALNAHDLEGVMAHGAPAGEYDPAAGGIIRFIEDGVLSPLTL